jgi:hypothetical protein
VKPEINDQGKEELGKYRSKEEGIEWKLLYRAREEYGLKDLSPTRFCLIIEEVGVCQIVVLVQII